MLSRSLDRIDEFGKPLKAAQPELSSQLTWRECQAVRRLYAEDARLWEAHCGALADPQLLPSAVIDDLLRVSTIPTHSPSVRTKKLNLK